MALAISTKSKSDHEVGHLTKEVSQSVKQGSVVPKVADILEQPDVSSGRASSLPATRPWKKLLDTLSGLCQTVKSVMTRLWSSIISIFYGEITKTPKATGVDLRDDSLENLENTRVNEDETSRTNQEKENETPRTDQEKLEQKTAKEESDKEAAAKVAAEKVEAATERTEEYVKEVLGHFLDVIEESEVDHTEHLRIFGELLYTAGRIKLPETDKALIADDLLSKTSNKYCDLVYCKLLDSVKQELEHDLAEDGFLLERVGSVKQINWQDPKVMTAVDKMCAFCPSQQLLTLRSLFCRVKTDLKKVEVLLEMMKLKVYDCDPKGTRDRIHSAIGAAFNDLTKELQDQLTREVWAAVLDPNNTTTDITILENKEVLKVEFSDLQETLETSDPDFGEKILKLDPCGELARKGLERWIINEDETPRTDQEELEQKTAKEELDQKAALQKSLEIKQVKVQKTTAEVEALKVEVSPQEKLNKMESLVQEGVLLASKLIETAAQADKLEAAATDRVVNHINGILGPLMNLMQKSGATSVEYLRTFGEILEAAATIELSETDKALIIDDLRSFGAILDAAATIELSETDKALIVDDLLSREIDAYCRSAYNNLPDSLKKELKAVLADQGFVIERIGSARNINWKDLQITTAIGQVLDSYPSCQLSKLQLRFCEAQTDFKKVDTLLDIMQIEVVEFDLDVTREKIHSAIGDLFNGLTKALQDQLTGEIWAAVLDPNNTTTDITILENKEVLRVKFSDLQETLETSDPDFGKKILKLDPCGELARKGVERWITNRDISSI